MQRSKKRFSWDYLRRIGCVLLHFAARFHLFNSSVRWVTFVQHRCPWAARLGVFLARFSTKQSESPVSIAAALNDRWDHACFRPWWAEAGRNTEWVPYCTVESSEPCRLKLFFVKCVITETAVTFPKWGSSKAALLIYRLQWLKWKGSPWVGVEKRWLSFAVSLYNHLSTLKLFVMRLTFWDEL